MRSLLSRGAPVISLMVLAFIAACSAPDRVSAPTLTPSGPPSHTQSLNGSVITLVDEDDGSQYTLDVNAQVVRFSDGRSLHFDYDQTTEALAAFHGTLEADSIDGTRFMPSAGCEDPTQLICGSSTQAMPAFRWRFVNKSKVSKDKEKKVSGGAGVGVQSSFDVCSDVATAAINAQGTFKSNRTSVWRNVFSYGVGGLFGDIMGRSYPAATATAALLAEDFINGRKRQTAISVLAYVWNTYECSPGSVRAGPIIDFRSGGGSGAGRTLVCTQQTVEFSFNGGQSWEAVIVTVCEYLSLPG